MLEMFFSGFTEDVVETKIQERALWEKKDSGCLSRHRLILAP